MLTRDPLKDWLDSWRMGRKHGTTVGPLMRWRLACFRDTDAVPTFLRYKCVWVGNVRPSEHTGHNPLTGEQLPPGLALPSNLISHDGSFTFVAVDSVELLGEFADAVPLIPYVAWITPTVRAEPITLVK